MSNILTLYVSQESISLIQLFLLGRREVVSQTTIDLFLVIGTQHFLAISGFHFGVLQQILQKIGGWMQRAQRGLSIVAVLLTYFWIIGPSPSVVRAVVMSVYGITAHYVLKRKHHSILSLLVAAMVIYCLFRDLFMSVGFQLSFMATAGLLLSVHQFRQSDAVVAMHSNETPAHSRKSRGLGGYIASTYFVSIVILFWIGPLILFYFETFVLTQLVLAPVITALFSVYIAALFLFSIVFYALHFLVIIEMGFVQSLLWTLGVWFDALSSFFVATLAFLEPLGSFMIRYSPTKQQLVIWYVCLGVVYFLKSRARNRAIGVAQQRARLPQDLVC